MGTAFRWLIGSSWLTNLGDGIEVAAGPLLIASLTQDPPLVALAAFLQRLPWLLFGLYAGVARRPHRPPRDGRGGEPAARRRPRRAGRDADRRPAEHRDRARRDAAARDRRGVRRHGLRDAAADGRRQGGPRDRQRAAHGRRGDPEPADRAGRRRRPLRRRHRVAVHGAGAARRARRRARRCGCGCRRSSFRRGSRTSCATSARACAGRGTTRRCARSRWRSSPSTSPGARRGRCSCSTRRSASAWAPSGSAC